MILGPLLGVVAGHLLNNALNGNPYQQTGYNTQAQQQPNWLSGLLGVLGNEQPAQPLSTEVAIDEAKEELKKQIGNLMVHSAGLRLNSPEEKKTRVMLEGLHLQYQNLGLRQELLNRGFSHEWIERSMKFADSN